MSIPLTNLDKFRIFWQITDNLCRLQSNMRVNAKTWKAMAAAESPPLATLQGFMTSGGAAYQARLGWVTALRNNPARRQRLMEVLTLLGMTEADVVDKIAPLVAVANQLAGAAFANYAAVIAACDQILATVDLPESLWPEE